MTMIINAYTGGWLAYTGYLEQAAHRFGFNAERMKDYFYSNDPGTVIHFKTKDNVIYKIIEKL